MLYGDSFQKVSYDASLGKEKGKYGDITVKPILTEDLFPDPSALTLDDCEYIDYVRYVHKRKVARMYAEELKALKKSVDDFSTRTKDETQLGEYLESDTTSNSDFTLQLVEHWYKTDEGKINCSIQIDGFEIKHIENYWEKTWRQNCRYPFNQIYRIRNFKSFWNSGEIDPIKDLIDLAEKKTYTGQLKPRIRRQRYDCSRGRRII